MDCHRLVGSEDEERIRRLCFHCHALEGTETQRRTAERVSPIIPEDYEFTPHAGVACTLCHSRAAAFDHDRQKPEDCRQCHLPHHEKKAHDLHGLVTCGACHLREVWPVRDPMSSSVGWSRTFMPGKASRIHDLLVNQDDKACRKCHRSGNEIGAAAMVLPPKSVLCMPCHAATFSVGDTTTIISLAIFLIGLALVFSNVFSGSTVRGEERGVGVKCLRIFGEACRTVFSGKLFSVTRTFFADVLLQRRLYQQSRRRWAIHGLIFYPFAFRFLWGMLALIGSLWKPEWSLVWPMLDRNRPVTAFLFDLTGIMVIVGIVFAAIRGMKMRRTRLPGTPDQDRIALILIGGIAAVGFVLEGMRIAMSGYPNGSGWAFLGYGMALLLGEGGEAVEFYGYVWYFHALLAGAFVAYIPFSRLLHMIVGPLVLAGNAAQGIQRQRG